MSSRKILLLIGVLFVLAGGWIKGQTVLPAAAQGPASFPTTSSGAPLVPNTSTPALSVKEVPSGAAPAHGTEQVAWALMAAYIIEYIKKTKWLPFISDESTARVKAQVGFLSALITTAGIHIAIGGNLFDPSGGTITITGLTFDALKDVIFQWVSQQAWYDFLVRKQQPTNTVGG